MRVTSLFFLLAGLTMPIAAFAQGEVSVERGLQVSIIGGCHDCHTEGYRETEGKIDPEKALMGNSVGWRGPWGTTYATNLRIDASVMTERGFVGMLKRLGTIFERWTRAICNRSINTLGRSANTGSRPPVAFALIRNRRRHTFNLCHPKCRRTDKYAQS
ncbi:hypothetical protein NKJ28_26275 [Mesorhizobium sp. M0145]|uniref:hypothetical protein n=1 Tax=Mesorhizobium sp. M0145 TaxID=2956895 RepID=UPI00333DAC32